MTANLQSSVVTQVTTLPRAAKVLPVYAAAATVAVVFHTEVVAGNSVKEVGRVLTLST
jgi:hypothetical protein